MGKVPFGMAILLLSGCAGSNDRPATSIGAPENQASPANPAIYTNPSYQQQIADLERRICWLEERLDPVTFHPLPNGEVAIQGSGREPRIC